MGRSWLWYPHTPPGVPALVVPPGMLVALYNLLPSELRGAIESGVAHNYPELCAAVRYLCSLCIGVLDV